MLQLLRGFLPENRQAGYPILWLTTLVSTRKKQRISPQPISQPDLIFHPTTTYGKGSSSAYFSIAAALRVFLPHPNAEQPLHYCFSGKPMLKDAIEALGIPHTEVGKVLLHGQEVSLRSYLLPEQHITVEGYTPGAALFSGKSEGKAPAFVLDVHLGKLAKELRLLGFDCLYRTLFTDAEIAEAAATENRIVLTRDVGLLKLSSVKYGYWLRSQKPKEQVREVLDYYAIHGFIRPFTRCISCNGIIVEVPKEEVLDQLPPNTRLYYSKFYRCTHCGKVYWEGSHHQHMLGRINNLQRPDK